MAVQQSFPVDEPPGSRVFVVCGKAVESDTLQAAFRPYGEVQSTKIIRDKGVAYVKFDKASSAALAIEDLNGAVLNNGRGPKLKVLLAEAPNSRNALTLRTYAEHELSADPDNVPARSRLFIVVPKAGDPRAIADDVSHYTDLEYCKTDLMSSKGVVFCKFSKASSALIALEDITTKGILAGYKVKCMLAEPKTKRGRVEGSGSDLFHQASQIANKIDNSLPLLRYGQSQLKIVKGSLSPAIAQRSILAAYVEGAAASGMLGSTPMNLQDFAGVAGLAGLATNITPFNGHLGTAYDSLTPQCMAMALPGASAGVGNLASRTDGVFVHVDGLRGTIGGQAAVSKQRLFVVVHKGVTEDMLMRLFRKFPGMEYCDLKKDRTTGKSKGYCYVNYSTPESAAAAVEQLNGAEFPPHSGHHIKVMLAEPLGVRQLLPSPTSDSKSHTTLGLVAGGHNVATHASKLAMSPTTRHAVSLSVMAGHGLQHSVARSMAAVQADLTSMSLAQMRSDLGAPALSVVGPGDVHSEWHGA